MGEAKRRKSRTERFLAKHPYCAYCGGLTPATTVDHVPQISIFLGRDRPSGLEVPACDACQSGARIDELATALFSRIYPDPDTDTGRTEIGKHTRGVKNNIPGLLEEMIPSPEQELRGLHHARRGGGVLNCGGPILNGIMNRYAGKIGCALHYQLVGRPVPPDGAVAAWWYSNVQAFEGKLPRELIDLLGAPQTLRQGERKQVADQFSYTSRATKDCAMTGHFATFRFSFAVCAIVAEDMAKIPPRPHGDWPSVYRPGFLKS